MWPDDWFLQVCCEWLHKVGLGAAGLCVCAGAWRLVTFHPAVLHRGGRHASPGRCTASPGSGGKGSESWMYSVWCSKKHFISGAVSLCVSVSQPPQTTEWIFAFILRLLFNNVDWLPFSFHSDNWGKWSLEVYGAAAVLSPVAVFIIQLSGSKLWQCSHQTSLIKGLSKFFPWAFVLFSSCFCLLLFLY